MANRMKDKWLGVTYPVPHIFQVSWFWNLWAKFMCPHGWHLLDECQSVESHSLYCDACDLDIPIAESARTTPRAVVEYLAVVLSQLEAAQPSVRADGACPECKQLAGYHKTDCQNWLWQL